MESHAEKIVDIVFSVFAISVFSIVALSPDRFIRAITLGRSNQSDVPRRMLKATQVVAGIAAVSLIIWLVDSALI